MTAPRKGRLLHMVPAKRPLKIAAGLLPALSLFFSLAALLPHEASAAPFFARQVGRNCSYCHTLVPKLNEKGRTFLANGYRFEAEESWNDVKDMTTIPLSLEVKAAATLNEAKTSVKETRSSNLSVEEVEIFGGGVLDSAGAVSAMAVAGFKEAGANLYEAEISQAFVRFNDIIGPAGAGLLNIKFGQSDIALPFLSQRQSLLGETYLAESGQGLLEKGARLVEFNGHLSFSENNRSVSHRYAIGAANEDVSDDDRLKGLYASYSASFDDDLNIGAIYRVGREKTASGDESYDKWGIAGEYDFGAAVLTAGFFRSIRQDSTASDNHVIEAHYMPLPKLGMAARYDVLRESGKKLARLAGLMIRYNVLQNAFAQLEYSALSDGDRLSGTNEESTNISLALAALF